MARKEIEVVSFVSSNEKPYDAYKKVDIEAIENSLENDNLTPMERRKLEVIYQNCLLLQKNSFNEKTRFLEEKTKSELRARRIQEMKQEKEKTLHARKIVIRAGIIALLAAGSIGGIKLYHDTQIKPIKILNEEYDKIYSSVTVENGQTLSEIAKEIYKNYPQDVKDVRTLDDLINEIANMNHIENINDIRQGQMLVIPKQYVEAEDEISTDKTY